jgi:cytochrome c-type biogenesis protein CcmE
MKRVYKKRLIFLGLLLSVLASTIGLALYALKENINLFYSPSELISKKEGLNVKRFYLGGLVKIGSVRHSMDQTQFLVTDGQHDVAVTYGGVLPDLFREGQSIVVAGKLNDHGVIIAQQVLAKHDERYQPRFN